MKNEYAISERYFASLIKVAALQMPVTGSFMFVWNFFTAARHPLPKVPGYSTPLGLNPRIRRRIWQAVTIYCVSPDFT